MRPRIRVRVRVDPRWKRTKHYGAGRSYKVSLDGEKTMSRLQRGMHIVSVASMDKVGTCRTVFSGLRLTN